MTTEKTLLKRRICILSNFVASIWTCSICQMLAIFPEIEFLRTLSRFKKRDRKISRRTFTSFIERGIRRFHVVVVQWTSKKCTRKAWCTCRAVVLLIKVMLHGTIRNDDFKHNTTLQCWNNVVTIWNNVATMLQRCVAPIIASLILARSLPVC